MYRSRLGSHETCGVDAQKQINLLTFDIIQFDYDYTTRISPLGRARTVQSFVCSILDLG